MLDIEKETKIQQAIDKQLDDELLRHIYRDHKDGTSSSLLFQMLPTELRSHIFSYCVATEQSVHVVPPKGNEYHGFRLSLCDETTYDLELGICRCNDSSRAGQTVTSEHFNNALFLVSKTVRREALDSFFRTNSFTFTCLYELQRFTNMFTRSSAKLQRIRLLERVDDYPTIEYRLEGIQSARSRLTGLKHLDLHLYLASWSAYETIYEDGLVDQVLHFALGATPKPAPSKKRKFEPDADSEAVSFGQIHKEVDASKVDAIAPVTDLVCKGKEKAAVKPVTTPKETGLQVPPLKSFAAHVRLRSSYINFRYDQSATDPKKAYYDAMFDRLSKHLTDVFMDGGRKYKTINDVPKLMDKPKLKIRDDERPLQGSEKRGILYMRD